MNFFVHESKALWAYTFALIFYILQRGGFLVSRAIANQNYDSRRQESVKDGGM